MHEMTIQLNDNIVIKVVDQGDYKELDNYGTYLEHLSSLLYAKANPEAVDV